MKQLTHALLLSIALALTSSLQIRADVNTEQVKQSLEQSRNTLLKQEDDYRRSYMETVTAIDNLNKQLETLNARKMAIEGALQRNNQSLKDIEYSLRNLH
jgi:phage shock protein A